MQANCQNVERLEHNGLIVIRSFILCWKRMNRRALHVFNREMTTDSLGLSWDGKCSKFECTKLNKNSESVLAAIHAVSPCCSAVSIIIFLICDFPCDQEGDSFQFTRSCFTKIWINSSLVIALMLILHPFSDSVVAPSHCGGVLPFSALSCGTCLANWKLVDVMQYWKACAGQLVYFVVFFFAVFVFFCFGFVCLSLPQATPGKPAGPKDNMAYCEKGNSEFLFVFPI